MDIESARTFCLSLPHATERVQWGHDLLFCVGDKMFAVTVLDAEHKTKLSFKCTPEKFAELIELDGIFPAPYSARYHWVALERFDALPATELKSLIKNSYQMVLDKLPKKIRATLSQNHLR
jgi:predicted DNA-binding protein (MmcQ/YjbR family)